MFKQDCASGLYAERASSLTYILGRDQADHGSLIYHRRRTERWKAYQSHLATYEKRIPPGALAFARADWHYDASDHRCPHDAWLEWVRIEEGSGTEPVNERSTQIVVRLLGAYHDGHLEITYRNVHAYALDMPRGGGAVPPRMAVGRPERRSHGDWLVDEVRSEGIRGRATHEIEWASGTNWIIDCGEIETVWSPAASSTAAEPGVAADSQPE